MAYREPEEPNSEQRDIFEARWQELARQIGPLADEAKGELKGGPRSWSADEGALDAAAEAEYMAPVSGGCGTARALAIIAASAVALLLVWAFLGTVPWYGVVACGAGGVYGLFLLLRSLPSGEREDFLDFDDGAAV